MEVDTVEPTLVEPSGSLTCRLLLKSSSDLVQESLQTLGPTNVYISEYYLVGYFALTIKLVNQQI